MTNFLSLLLAVLSLGLIVLLRDLRRMKSERAELENRSNAITADLQSQLALREQQVANCLEVERKLREQLQLEVQRSARAEEMATQTKALQDELELVTRENSELRALSAQLQTSQAQLEVSLAAEKRSYEEKLAAMEQARQKLSETFRSLSAEALTATSKQFLELAEQRFGRHQESSQAELDKRKQEIDTLLKPVAEALKGVDSKLGDLEKARTSAYVGLVEQLRLQQETVLRLQGETSSLVHALRSSTARGSWGEIQLRRVVEIAGMLPHCDFVEQSSREHEGQLLRPDMIVRLPDSRQIVVDAKAPLKMFLEALEESDGSLRKQKMLGHARSLRLHIQNLGAKNYWEQFQPSPDFVILFLPGEAFLSAAMEVEPDLIEFGVERQVLLATPTSLIGLLKAVAYGWRQQSMARSADIVRELGRELYQRVLTLSEHMMDLRGGLDKAVASYNRTVSAMESRVLVTMRKFQELGVGTTRDVPELEIIDKSPREPLRLIKESTSEDLPLEQEEGSN